MKKLLLFILLFQVNFIVFSQAMTKVQLTNDIYDALYGNSSDPNDYPAADFPTMFFDLNEGSDFETKAKLLAYLQYGDGVPVLYNRANFNTSSIPYHVSIIKSLIEAWNIPLVTSGVTLPYDDVDSSTLYYEHILTAYDIGMLDNTTSLNPYLGLEYLDAYLYITFLSNSAYPIPTQSDLLNIDNYLAPNNYTPYNIGFNRGLEQGVFSHYAKNSFVIPDVKLNLNFSHSYSTQMVELDESFFPIKPLGRGWTHTYNSYAVKETNNGETIYTIVWSDGTINIWNENNQEYITNGVYDDFDEYSSSRIYITKKNQTRYRFQRLNSDREIFYLTEIRDRNDNEINIYYEDAEENDTKRIEYVTSPSGKHLEFQYVNNTDLIDIIRDPIDREIAFEYSGLSSGWVYTYPVLTTFEDARGNYTNYSYDINNSSGLHPLKRIELPEDNIITAQYDDNIKLTEYSINDDNIEVAVNYDDLDAISSVVTMPMPSGTQDFNYQFNENGNLTQFSNDTDNITFSYNAPENININRPNNVNKNGLEVDYEYDDKGNVTRIITEGDLVERFWYNSNNDITKYRDANGNETEFYYNNGNLTSIKDALNHYSNFTYDSYGQMRTSTNQEGITINYTYENDGAVETISAPENMSASFNYDGINRMLSKTINGQTTSYTYDPNDNLITHTNIGGLTTSFNYDRNDNVTTITNANGVTTNFEYNDKDQVTKEQFGSLVKRYEYNDDGTLDKYTKPSGNEINYSYDSEGRLDETGTITDINYYSSGNEKGLLRKIYNTNGYYRYYYDNYNRVDKVKDYFNNTDVIEYDYDDVGNIIEITYPNNPVDFKVVYTYDAKNRMTKVKTRINGNEETKVSYYYRDDDKLEWVFYKNGDTFNVRKHYDYDDIGRLKLIDYNRIPASGGGTDIQLYREELNIDNKGNILSDDKYYGVAETNYTLTQETQAYNYDNNNQITQAGTTNYNVNNDGNTIQKGSLNLNYDIDDRLTSINGNNGTTTVNIQHKYDVYGNRIEKNIITGTTNPGTRKYVWDVMNNNIIKEYNPNGSEQLFYIYGASGLEFALNPNIGNIEKFYHGDVRGSVIFATDTNANIIDNKFNKYDDFGNFITAHSTDTEEYGAFYYLGKHGIISDVTAYDGLYQVKARYYDAKLGRFLTQDPIWSTNLYPYANNNPVSNVDVNGKKHGSIYVEGSATDNILKLAYESGQNPFSSSPDVTWCDVSTVLGYYIELRNDGLKGLFNAVAIDQIMGNVMAKENAGYMVEYYESKMALDIMEYGRVKNSSIIWHAIYNIYYNDYYRDNFFAPDKAVVHGIKKIGGCY